MLDFQKDTVPREVAQNAWSIMESVTERKCARANRALVAVRLWILSVLQPFNFGTAERASKMSTTQPKKSKKGYL